jgi:hypothetical protein
LPGQFIGYLDLNKAMMGERLGLAHLAVHENLEYRGRRIRRALKNLRAPRVPARRRKQAPSPVQ